MKTTTQFKNSVSDACVKSCQKVLSQVAKAKDVIMAQFHELVADHEEVLRLALNEAEALAWQSEYPELVFQDLAEEKAARVVSWVAHQKSVLSGLPFRE